MNMHATPSGRVDVAVARRRLQRVGPKVVQHYGGMYFAIVFTDADRLDAIELAELGAVPALEGQ